MVDRGQHLDRSPSSSVRHSTATQPWPTAGTNSSTARTLGDPIGQPEDLERGDRHHDRAAVGDLREPGVDVAAQLDELEVGTDRRELGAAADRAGGDGAPCASDRRASAPTSASAGSRRSQNAASARPSAGADGRSLAECTARSARPSSTARCTSLTNTPWPPITWSGTSRRTSPVVSTITSSTSRPVAAVMRVGDGVGLAERLTGPPGRESQRRLLASRRAHPRSKRSRTAAALRSPCGVPAWALRRTDGSCSSLATIARVSASTASRLRLVEVGEAGGEAVELGDAEPARLPRASMRRAAPPGGPSTRRGTARPPRRRSTRTRSASAARCDRPRSAQSRRSSRSSSVTPARSATAGSTLRGHGDVDDVERAVDARPARASATSDA